MPNPSHSYPQMGGFIGVRGFPLRGYSIPGRNGTWAWTPGKILLGAPPSSPPPSPLEGPTYYQPTYLPTYYQPTYLPTYQPTTNLPTYQPTCLKSGHTCLKSGHTCLKCGPTIPYHTWARARAHVWYGMVGPLFRHVCPLLKRARPSRVRLVDRHPTSIQTPN